MLLLPLILLPENFYIVRVLYYTAVSAMMKQLEKASYWDIPLGVNPKVIDVPFAYSRWLNGYSSDGDRTKNRPLESGLQVLHTLFGASYFGI